MSKWYNLQFYRWIYKIVPYIYSLFWNAWLFHTGTFNQYFFYFLTLKINSSSGKKKKIIILTESNETYIECSRLQINDMCQTILEENLYWLSNEHRKTRKSRYYPRHHVCCPIYSFLCTVLVYFTKTRSNLLWFWWLQNLAVHTNTYMLHDQLFLILSTPFLSQCNRITSTKVYL